MKSLRVATCQFAVEAEIAHNRRFVLRQLEQAASAGADLGHFSETALSGYASVDSPGTDAIDWDELTAATRDVMAAARRLRLWVLLGSTHRLSDGVKPHNCVYVIDSKGKIVDRYDKRCTFGSAYTVQALYLRLLNREAGAGEVAGHVAGLGGGHSQTHVALSFLRGPEFTQCCGYGSGPGPRLEAKRG